MSDDSSGGKRKEEKRRVSLIRIYQFNWGEIKRDDSRRRIINLSRLTSAHLFLKHKIILIGHRRELDRDNASEWLPPLPQEELICLLACGEISERVRDSARRWMRGLAGR